MMVTEEIWLELSPGTSMSIDRAQAMSLDIRGFARLYRRHVISASRREAREWAIRQVELRAASSGTTEETSG